MRVKLLYGPGDGGHAVLVTNAIEHGAEILFPLASTTCVYAYDIHLNRFVLARIRYGQPRDARFFFDPHY